MQMLSLCLHIPPDSSKNNHRMEESVTGAASGMKVRLHPSLLLGSLPESFSGSQVWGELQMLAHR